MVEVAGPFDEPLFLWRASLPIDDHTVLKVETVGAPIKFEYVSGSTP